ncbi:hypothetical protein [Myroides marinus]|uniref:hypothetical protein n=1 Tax=Myroides marinus TaxID=703342 RepID=UPI002577FCBA|nr:hypothetical protein [Myroides marinus]MDM1346496.1 hypothetical protein [Myroides marinus]MDM1349915.1 hypothetical protein [Myroides marinus]MDM1357123.1 hypothetical protein [Myroides marinus]
MSTYFKQIQEILESNDFRERLEKVNDNFPNLKQEHLIRDVILTMYNQKYSSDYKAFSEHPRKWKLNNGDDSDKNIGRVDLSLNKATDLQNPYKIELKFFFTKDIKNGRKSSIEKNYVKKECDLLIIIVQEFLDVKAKEEYDKRWDIDTDLLQYQIKDDAKKKQKTAGSDDKFEILEKQFKKVEDYVEGAHVGQHHNKIQIEVQLPYKTRYTFCFLERKK